MEILVSPGSRLSHEIQDGMSFRYGIINVGAADPVQGARMLRTVDQSLPYSFFDNQTLRATALRVHCARWTRHPRVRTQCMRLADLYVLYDGETPVSIDNETYVILWFDGAGLARPHSDATCTPRSWTSWTSTAREP